MSEANKQWIEFVEKHTRWEWSKKRQSFELWLTSFDPHNCMATAEPEDLKGWQIRFAEECGTNLLQVAESMPIILPNSIFERLQKAWDKFMDLLEVELEGKS